MLKVIHAFCFECRTQIDVPSEGEEVGGVFYCDSCLSTGLACCDQCGEMVLLGNLDSYDEVCSDCSAENYWRMMESEIYDDPYMNGAWGVR